jgi:hypothetical protein
VNEEQKKYLKVVAIAIIILLLFWWKRVWIINFLGSKSVKKIEKPKTTGSANSELSQASLIVQQTSLESQITTLTNQLNSSNNTNGSLAAQIADLQAQLAVVQNDLNYCESKVINLFHARKAYNFGGTGFVSVDFGENFSNYIWLKDGTTLADQTSGFAYGSAGKYTVIANDGAVEVTKSLIVGDISASALTNTLTAAVKPTSPTSSDGEVSVTISGGTPPYRIFSLDNYNNFKEGLTGLPNGRIRVFAVDSLGYKAGFYSFIMSQLVTSYKFAKIGFMETEAQVYTGQKKSFNLGITSNLSTPYTYTVNGSFPAPATVTEGTTYNLVLTETSTGEVFTDSVTIPISQSIVINKTIINASGGLANGAYIVNSLSGTRSQNIIEISFFSNTTARYYKDFNKLKSGNYSVVVITDLGEYISDNVNI